MFLRMILAAGLVLALVSGCTTGKSEYSRGFEQGQQECAELRARAGQEVELSDENALEAGETLAAFLTEKGYDVAVVNELVAVDRDGSRFLLEPRMSAQGIDFLMVTKFYKVRPAWEGQQEIYALAAFLNTASSYARFGIDHDGDFVIQAELPFHSRLSEILLSQFLDRLDQNISATSTAYGLTEFLE